MITQLNWRFVFAVLGFICSTQTFGEAKSAAVCATVAWVDGEKATAQGITATLGQKLKPGDWIETQDESRVKLLFKDNSVVDLGPNSKFKITSCGALASDENIDLELEFGAIRTQVIKAVQPKTKEFRLKTPTSLLGVRGTEFFVRWQKDTSSDDFQEQISVLEGAVEVSSLFDKLKPFYRIEAGEEFRVNWQVNSAEPTYKNPPQVDQFNAKEQKEIESETQVKSDLFSKKLKMEGVEKNSPEANKKREDFILSVLADEEGKVTLNEVKREVAQEGQEQKNNRVYDLLGGYDLGVGAEGCPWKKEGFPIYKSVTAGMN